MSEQQRLRPVPWTQVKIKDAFWSPWQETNRRVTLPIEYQRCQETGRLDALKQNWVEGMPNRPHHFWDSDVAKWLEAVGYSLATHPDPELEARADAVIAGFAAAQQPDGYLNTYYTVIEPEKRWSNLKDMHELYCAGHLMEGAVAYYQGTGKRQLLEVMCRYADYIGTVFGRGEGQLRGYPGHEEIELGLVKLYEVTGEQRYLDLATYFVDERGQKPNYFDLEVKRRGDAGGYGSAEVRHWVRDTHLWPEPYAYFQAHRPLHQQDTAEGHAVRAMYIYCGMADVAAHTGDEQLKSACRRLWHNVTRKRMYVTGGIGSSSLGERFTVDYDLPNDVAYAETCAAIGLAFWAHRMVQMERDREYADVLELALYNGTLSGIQQTGDLFFYANPLEVVPERYAYRPELFRGDVIQPRRQPWFNCSCCPTNITRVLSSIGHYVYASDADALYVHLYVSGQASVALAGGELAWTMDTRYPWDGQIKMILTSVPAEPCAVALRIPGWCQGATATLNGHCASTDLLDKGYLIIRRQWAAGDVLTLVLPMPIRRLQAHPEVRNVRGKVALQRGPLVYCLEQVDNGANLADITLPADAALEAQYDPELLGGATVVFGQGRRADAACWEDALYRPVGETRHAVPIKAVPYYLWANREVGEMLVWIAEN